MSNILVLIEPIEGHFNPLAPIIKQFVARKHNVVCLTGKAYQQQIEAMGATFIPIPEQWDIGKQEIYDFFPALKQLKGVAQIKYYIKHIMYDQVPDILAALNQVLQDFPADVIIGDTFMVAGAWKSELGGPPSVRISVLSLSLPGKDIAPFGLGLLPGKSFFTKLRNNLLNVLFEKVLFQDVHRYVNSVRQKVGLPAYQHYFFLNALETPNLVLHLSTPSFEYPRKQFPENFRFIGPVLVPPKNEFHPPIWWDEVTRDQDIPVILINQGTVAKNYADLILPTIEALKNERMLVLAVPVTDGTLDNLPANTRTAAYVPFGNLLPYIDLMITNGGWGGIQTALAHGIPLIIAGTSEDKMEAAARVEHAGVGINLRIQKPSAEDIHHAVREILDNPAYKQKARALQQDIAQYDAPVMAVEQVEALIAREKLRG